MYGACPVFQLLIVILRTHWIRTQTKVSTTIFNTYFYSICWHRIFSYVLCFFNSKCIFLHNIAVIVTESIIINPINLFLSTLVVNYAQCYYFAASITNSMFFSFLMCNNGNKNLDTDNASFKLFDKDSTYLKSDSVS